MPWPSCGDIPACPGDSPGDASTCNRGLFLASEAKAGSRIPREIRGWFPWMGFFFPDGFCVKQAPRMLQLKRLSLAASLAKQKMGGCWQFGGNHSEPSCQPGSGCGLGVSWGLCCPAQTRSPPEAGGGLWTMPSSISHWQPMAEALLGLRQGFFGHLQPPRGSLGSCSPTMVK